MHRRNLVLIALLGTAAACTNSLQRSNGLAFVGAEIRVAPVAATSAAAYLTIRNDQATTDTLLAVTGDVARTITLENSEEHGGMSMMMRLESVAILPGDSVTFAVGGRHIMLDSLTQPIKPGNNITLQLHFTQGRSVSLKFPVKVVGD